MRGPGSAWKARLEHASPHGQDRASQWMNESLFRQPPSAQPDGADDAVAPRPPEAPPGGPQEAPEVPAAPAGSPPEGPLLEEGSVSFTAAADATEAPPPLVAQHAHTEMSACRCSSLFVG